MDTIGIFDLSGFQHWAWALKEKNNEDDRQAFLRIRSRIVELSKEYNVTKTVVAIDRKPTERLAIFPEYKAGRKSKGEDFSAWRSRVENGLANLFDCYFSTGWEADDVIATMSEKYHRTHKIINFTRDKDCMQLVKGSQIVQVDPITGDFYDEEKVKDKFGFSGLNLVAYQAIVGDSADNIRGVYGIGPKKARSLALVGGDEGISSEQLEQYDFAYDLVYLRKNITLEKLMHQPIEEPEHPHVKEALEGLEEPTKTPITVAGHEEIPDEPAPESTEQPITPRPQEKVTQANDEIELRHGLVLSNARIDVLQRLAKGYARGGLYSRIGDETSIFTVLMMGVELGLSTTAALNGVHIMNGKIVMGAHLLIGLARRDKACEYFDCAEADESQATYVCKKVGRDKEMSFTYTMKDAENDGMSWARKLKNRKAMLRKTAGLQAARLWFPKATSGLYGHAEMGIDSED